MAPRIHAVKMIAHQWDGNTTYEDTSVDHADPMFATTPPPITRALGFPLVIAKLPSHVGMLNQRGTWLMINPKTGFAPMSWQNHVGDLVVARQDKEPFNVETMVKIMDYIWAIILNAEWRDVVRSMYNRQKLDQYLVRFPLNFRDAPLIDDAGAMAKGCGWLKRSVRMSNSSKTRSRGLRGSLQAFYFSGRSR